MAKGYPNRITRTSLGPTYVNMGKIGNPKTAADADAFNLLCWQASGMNGPAARGLLYITGGGVASPTIARQWFAWDPNQQLAPATVLRTTTGSYTWSLPDAGAGIGVYPDMNGVNTSAGLFATNPIPQGPSGGFVYGANAQVDPGGVSGLLNTYVFGSFASADFVNLLLLLY